MLAHGWVNLWSFSVLMLIYEDIQVGILLELLVPFFFFVPGTTNLPKVLFSFPFVSIWLFRLKLYSLFAVYISIFYICIVLQGWRKVKKTFVCIFVLMLSVTIIFQCIEYCYDNNVKFVMNLYASFNYYIMFKKCFVQKTDTIISISFWMSERYQ